jgi:hypothetical protein
MTSVAELRSKFDKPTSSPHSLSPSSFEKYRREQALRSAEEVKAAREKARKYNSALRTRTLKRNQVQKAKLELAPPPEQPKRFPAVETSRNSDLQLLLPKSLPTPKSIIAPPPEASNEHTVIVDSTTVQANNPMFVTSTNPFFSEGDSVVPVQPFPGEEGYYVEDDAMLDTGASTRGDRRSTNLSKPKSPEQQPVAVAFPSTSADAAAPRAYEWIRRTVLMNKPSTGDLLMSGAGERHYSVTSVGPKVDVTEDVCRLDADVDIRTVLTVFYQTYAPEKLPDVDLVLNHFKGRREALLFTLECKYLVTITPEGRVEPQRPFDAYDAHLVEDEISAARRASQRMSIMSTASEMTDLTTNSYKGYLPASMADGLPSSLISSWAVPPKHNSGGGAATTAARSSALRLREDRLDSSGFI